MQRMQRLEENSVYKLSERVARRVRKTFQNRENIQKICSFMEAKNGSSSHVREIIKREMQGQVSDIHFKKFLYVSG